jgi:hypothetical protein
MFMKTGISRRNFIKSGTLLLLAFDTPEPFSIETVNGNIPISEMGSSLIHEHFLVDFKGSVGQ